MAYRGREREIDPRQWADIYLRLSSTGENRYAFDLWSAQNEWHSEQTLPDSAVAFLRRVVNEPYFQADFDELQEVASALWVHFIPEDVRQLATAYFTEERLRAAAETLSGLLGKLFERGPRIRLELRAPLLAYLPWEYLPFFERLALPPATYPARLILPQFDMGALSIEAPLRVLYVSANPSRSKVALDEGAELYQFTQALQQVAGDNVVVESLMGVGLDLLREKLTSGAAWYHVFHFVGHGFLSPSGPMIALERGRRSQFVSPAELGDLARSGGVRLLTLQTPIGVANYQLAAFAGFGAQARALGLPAVLYSLAPDRAEIPDIVRIYAALAKGVPVDRACGEARHAAPGTPSVLALTLHTQSSNLFQVAGMLEGAELLTGLKGEAAFPTRDALRPKGLIAPKSPPRAEGFRGPRALVESKQILQQIDFVQGNIRHLERMQETYQATQPDWLDEELGAQQDRLGQLLGELDEEA